MPTGAPCLTLATAGSVPEMTGLLAVTLLSVRARAESRQLNLVNSEKVHFSIGPPLACVIPVLSKTILTFSLRQNFKYR